MTAPVLVRHTARVIAIAIAIAALIDPTIAARRAAKPEVVVIAADRARDSARANAVARALARTFTVVSAPFAKASGTVVVGNAPPASSEGLPNPAFAVTPTAAEPSVRITKLEVPRRASSSSRIPVTIGIDATGARGRMLDVDLRAGGMLVERTTHPAGDDGAPVRIATSYVATDTGAVALRVTAALRDLPARDSANAVLDVHDRRWRVLFFDARPSWTSTFVRRAVERDSRFTVTSRIVTSRGVSTVAGSAPDRLDDASMVNSFEAIVVGAPDALADADVRGLEAFARRGGSVIVLLDQTPAPGVADAWTRLVGSPSWQSSTTSDIVPVATSADSAALLATELTWPATLPSAAEAIARARLTEPVVRSRGGASTVALMWRAPLGLGEIIVDGALDAWRNRDASRSRFDTFWPSIVAGAAAAAVPPLDVAIASPSLAPGERTTITVTARDSSILLKDVGSGLSAIVAPDSATVGRPPSIDTVPLWPAAQPNTFVGLLRAPTERGTYRVQVRGGDAAAEAPIIVDPAASHARRAERDLLAAWSTARGGRVLDARDAGALASELRSAIDAPVRATVWHPFRSGWWIVPFALTLCLDWWLRRRAGLA